MTGIRSSIVAFLLVLGSPYLAGQSIWDGTNGIWLGRVGQFQSARDGSLLGAGSPGVFRSTDRGLSWQTTDLPSFVVNFAVDTTGRILAGTKSEGLYRSNDHGRHWFLMNKGLSSLEVIRLEACPDGGVLAIMKNGLYRVAKGDSVWTLVNAVIVDSGAVFVQSNSTGVLFAGTLQGVIFKSLNGGTTWTRIANGNTFWDLRGFFIDKRDNIFRSIAGMGVYRSSNGGTSWELVHYADAAQFAEGPTGTLFGGTGSGIIRSLDSGKTWVRIPSEPGPYAVAVTAMDEGVVVWSGLDSELFRSTDNGSTYAPQYPGPGGQVITCLAATNTGVVFAGAFSVGIFRSTDGGTSWMQSDRGMTNRAVNAIALGAGQLSLAATQQGLFISSDNGTSWARRDSGMTANWTNDILASLDGRLFAATTGGGLFTSPDTGKSWSRLEVATLPTEIRKLAMGKEGVMYAAGHPGGVYRSTDGGIHWAYLTGGPGKGEYVRGLAADQSGHVAALTLTSLTLSTNGGDTWRDIGSSFSQQLWDVFIDRSSSLYLATYDEKVYRSTDNGSTWTDFRSGLPATGSLVSDFVQDASGRLIAGTLFGVFRTANPTTGIATAEELPSRAIQILPSYPNPFNGMTQIRFFLPSRMHVTLTVYNTLGQRVADLMDDLQDAGLHDIPFDATHLPSGVYYYSLQAGGARTGGRALLVK